MLQLDCVSKSYTTGSFTQVALDEVSLAFRDNEFVSILGPSGSGKTTMLNVIGGLDHFDSGDLVIDGISTKEFKDRDWDAYRNNRIGFVFQSYNLIPHQTILANVELALTLSGVSPAERRKRARKALEDVGLGEHVDKRPSQLSGGQMQRVAIARALINDPEILLADEPTGALDSATSVQVMDLLREVAADRLVIMVTHNPELARQYSTRIVELADGRICSDTDPYRPSPEDMRSAAATRYTSMGFLTALTLSFNNLMTKKGRTIMTAFAGSIGIIGIAAILALANGVNAYIQEVEESTLSVYPLQIMSSGFDVSSMLVDLRGTTDNASGEGSGDESVKGEDRVGERRMVTSMFGSVGKNDLAALKTYLDGNGGDIQKHVQAIEYKYGVVPYLFTTEKNGDVRQVNPDTTFSAFGFGASSSSLFTSSSAFSSNVFSQMPSDLSLVQDQFDVKAGHWPQAHDELVLVLSRNGKIADIMSYTMGLRDHDELEDMVTKLVNEEEFEAPTDERSFTYDELMSPEFVAVPLALTYAYEDEFGVWTSKAEDQEYMKSIVRDGLKLHIVGIVQAKEDVDATSLTQGIYYTSGLTRWLMDQAASSRIVRDQLAEPTKNVISGKSFEAEAKERGKEGNFDMDSLFSIDEGKMKDAFKVDANGLDFSNMDFSGLDFSSLASAFDLSSMNSGLDLSGMALPAMDFSGLSGLDFSDVSFDMSGIDLSGIELSDLLDPDVLATLAPYFERIDVAKLMEGVTPTVDTAKIRLAVAEAIQGLGPYLGEHRSSITSVDSMRQAIHDYFAQDALRQKLREGAVGAVTFSDADKARMTQNLMNQMKEVELTEDEKQRIGERTQEVASKLAAQVAGQFAEKMASQLESKLSQALGQTLGSTMQAYMEQVMTAVMTQLGTRMQEQLTGALSTSMQQAMGSVMERMMQQMADVFSVDEKAFAEAFEFKMDEKELSQLMSTLMSTERTSYDKNLVKLGYTSIDKPSEIDIYPVNFDSKAEVTKVLDDYNNRMREEDEGKVITYTDVVGALMTSVTDIVNMISYVLIAFVAISLIVSSIMIGVITYISVLERKKEIGILRSIGASKRDVSRVFNAETVIEGFVSGVMGVTITAIACIPANIIVEQIHGIHDIARLPVGAAIILIGISVFLSFIAGLIPSSKAAKADPVEALRSE